MFNSDLVPQGDSLSFFINVLKDKFPSIVVEQFQDSTENNIYYFAGNASDDYGLEKINFNYEIISANGSIIKKESIPVTDKPKINQTFDYIFDLNNLQINAGEEAQFFF